MHTNFLNTESEKISRSIEGSLSLMPLSDLIQWIENSRRSGTLIAINENCSRRFYFQDGSLIFLWSDIQGERFCEEIHRETGLPIPHIEDSMQKAEKLGISFMGYLSSENGVPIEQLSKMMTSLSERAITSSMTWKTGQFRFYDFLPAPVLYSPVILRPSQLLFESAIEFDKTGMNVETSLDPVIDELYEIIRRGTIDIPPIPAEMQLLMNRMNDPELSVNDIIECITDPILVSKAIRICNSSFYGHRGKVNTLREAVVYMGLKSLMSIVTVHALSGFAPKNPEKVEAVLHHSMSVGMIARQLARHMGANHEQAFICGLLHDIGWIVMLDILAGYELSDEKLCGLIRTHHATVGGLVAKRWNFSDEMQEVIRFHHDPAGSKQFETLVQVIYLSNLIAKKEAPRPDCGLSAINNRMLDILPSFNDHLEELDREINSILSPTRENSL